MVTSPLLPQLYHNALTPLLVCRIGSVIQFVCVCVCAVHEFRLVSLQCSVCCLLLTLPYVVCLCVCLHVSVFGLWLDSDLNVGSSGRCTAYDNPPLCTVDSKGQFLCVGVEAFSCTWPHPHHHGNSGVDASVTTYWVHAINNSSRVGETISYLMFYF